MKQIVFLKEAEEETLDAAKYYESKADNLGIEFLAEVENPAQRISDNPEAAPIVRSNIRRSLLPRFPFGILYGMNKKEIVVIAVMHLRCSPEYWHDRY